MSNELLTELDNDSHQIDIYVKQLNGRKRITQINGLSIEQIHNIVQKLRHSLNCRATIRDNIIELSGNQSEKVKDFLIKECMINQKSIRVHGGYDI